MKPDQSSFHDPRHRKWLGGFFTFAVAAGAVLWVIILAGLAILAWQAVLG